MKNEARRFTIQSILSTRFYLPTFCASIIFLCVLISFASQTGEEETSPGEKQIAETTFSPLSPPYDKTSEFSLKKPEGSEARTILNDEVRSEKRDIGVVFAEYQSELEKLAQKCDATSMPLEARITRSFIYSNNSTTFVVPLLPKRESLKNLPKDATKDQHRWYSALNRLKRTYADELYAFAEHFGEKKRGYDVVACVLTTLFVNPDHEKARNFLGYKLLDGYWRSSWEQRQLSKGLVPTEKYGWIPEEYVERYQKGDRFYKNRWISEQEEAKKILESASGWRVETEHFTVLSRVSLERGVEISRFLEAFYETWRRLFYKFIASESQWNSRLYTCDEMISKRHKVILYRNRNEYLKELKKHDPNVAFSVGGYFPEFQCTFVYESEEEGDSATLLQLLAHETTHQLFDECATSSQSRNKVHFKTLARVGNFWAIEGISVYAETFRLDSSGIKATLGGYKDVFRIQCALESLFENHDYLPLRQYAGLSREDFQNRRDIATLYSQAAGLSFFFMHYNNGEYRDSFISYIYDIYQGMDRLDTLEQLTGKTFEELDEEYKNFMFAIYNDGNFN